MSSPDEDEGSVSRVGFDPESGQRASTLGFALGSRQNRGGQGRGRFPDPEGFVGQQHVMEAEGQVPRARSGSLADFQGATLASFGNRVAMAVPQRLSNQDARGFRGRPSPESSNREVSTVWLDPEPGPSGRSTRARGWLGSQMASNVRFHFRGAEEGWAWGSVKKGLGYRPKGSVGRQRAFEEGQVSLPWSDSESSDEFSEMQLMRGSIGQKGGGRYKLTSLSDTPGHWGTQARGKFLPVTGPCLSFAPRTLASGEEGQAVGDPQVSSEKPHSVTGAKAGSRPSYPPLVAAAGGLPKATPRRKVAQEKTSLEGASEVVRKSHALTPSGTKESKPTGPGQNSVAQRNSGAQPVVGEGEDPEPSREPIPESHSPTHGQNPSFPCQYGGESDTGPVNNRHTQDPAQSEPLVLTEGEVLASGPALSSDLDPPDKTPAPERVQQPQQEQPPGAEGCPRCQELQRGIHELRQQLVAMRSLADKLQKL